MILGAPAGKQTWNPVKQVGLDLSSFTTKELAGKLKQSWEAVTECPSLEFGPGELTLHRLLFQCKSCSESKHRAYVQEKNSWTPQESEDIWLFLVFLCLICPPLNLWIQKGTGGGSERKSKEERMEGFSWARQATLHCRAYEASYYPSTQSIEKQHLEYLSVSLSLLLSVPLPSLTSLKTHI